jgi:hypothetical protein
MSRVLTAALRLVYVLFGVGCGFLAARAALQHQKEEAIVYAVVAVSWMLVVLWISRQPSRWHP